MDLTHAYSRKAEYYCKYRWRYAPEAIDAIFAVTGLSAESTIADIGSGTGILTRELIDRAKCVYAVEPDPAMQALAERDCGQAACFRSVLATAEATTLSDHSVDLIAVAQALHWFHPEPTRCEFLRILKPGGWLGILWNYPTDPELQQASAELQTEANGWNAALDTLRPAQPPLSYYFGHAQYLEKGFPFCSELDWDAFLGSLLTDARSPDKDNPCYPSAAACQRRIFERFSSNGRIKISGCTQLVVGRMRTE